MKIHCQKLFFFLNLALILVLIFIPVKAQSSIGYKVGEQLTYDIECTLRGQSGNYYGYKEYEDEQRIYQILSVTSNEVHWSLTGYWRYRDTDGYSDYDPYNEHFSTHPTNFSYLDNSYDGMSSDLDYYTFDTFWIRINPDVELGQDIHILGNDYEVLDTNHQIWYKGKFVEAIQVYTSDTSENVYNDDYDPDGVLQYSFTETYYYDVHTGYLLKSEWDAEANTSVGHFSWHEEIELASSTLVIPISSVGIVLIIVMIFIVMILLWLFIKSYTKYIDITFNILKTQQYKEPKHKFRTRLFNIFTTPFYSHQKLLFDAPTLWKPLQVPYTILLPKEEGEFLQLKNGIFVVLDPLNRMGLIDITEDKLHNTHIAKSSQDHIITMYKLALGTISTDELEAIQTSPNLYLLPESKKDLFNRTAEEVLLLCEDFKTLKSMAKFYGWGRAYRKFYNYVSELPKDSPVKHIVDIVDGDVNKPKQRIPKDIADITKKTGEFGERDNILMRILHKYEQLTPQGCPSQVYELLSKRKVIDYTLGQAPLTPESHYRKYQKILEFQPQKVLMVGDDDLISITLARNNIMVYVLEIDPYTCALIHLIAQRENLPIHLYQVDLRDALPTDIPNDFDLFVADPDFTYLAFGLFACRGLSKLREGGYGLVNFEGKSYHKYVITRLLQKIGVDILNVIQEKWEYVSVANRKTRIQKYYSSGYYGKYSGYSYYYDYKYELVLEKAPYFSQMYIFQKTDNTQNPLEAQHSIKLSEELFYDL